jgi:hypothetical protein
VQQDAGRCVRATEDAPAVDRRPRSSILGLAANPFATRGIASRESGSGLSLIFGAADGILGRTTDAAGLVEHAGPAVGAFLPVVVIRFAYNTHPSLGRLGWLADWLQGPEAAVASKVSSSAMHSDGPAGPESNRPDQETERQ